MMIYEAVRYNPWAGYELYAEGDCEPHGTYERALEALLDAGHPDPVGALRRAKQGWLQWVCFDTYDGPRLAVGVNGTWELATDEQLAELFELDGMTEQEAKSTLALVKQAAMQKAL